MTEFVTVIIPRMVIQVPVVREFVRDRPEGLTEAEQRIFPLLCSGMVHKEIAAAVNLSYRTVKFHACNIYRKAEVNDRLEFLAKYSKPEAPPSE